MMRCSTLWKGRAAALGGDREEEEKKEEVVDDEPRTPDFDDDDDARGVGIVVLLLIRVAVFGRREGRVEDESGVVQNSKDRRHDLSRRRETNRGKSRFERHSKRGLDHERTGRVDGSHGHARWIERKNQQFSRGEIRVYARSSAGRTNDLKFPIHVHGSETLREQSELMPRQYRESGVPITFTANEKRDRKEINRVRRTRQHKHRKRLLHASSRRQ